MEKLISDNNLRLQEKGNLEKKAKLKTENVYAQEIITIVVCQII